jgi:hypothetical protein
VRLGSPGTEAGVRILLRRRSLGRGLPQSAAILCPVSFLQSVAGRRARARIRCEARKPRAARDQADVAIVPRVEATASGTPPSKLLSRSMPAGSSVRAEAEREVIALSG